MIGSSQTSNSDTQLCVRSMNLHTDRDTVKLELKEDNSISFTCKHHEAKDMGHVAGVSF